MKRISRTLVPMSVLAVVVAVSATATAAAVGGWTSSPPRASDPAGSVEEATTGRPVELPAADAPVRAASYTTEGDAPAGTVAGPDGSAFALTVAAPQTIGDLPVSLDTTEIMQYWWWASGVVVTATGLPAGQDVTITDTTPSGKVFTYAPATADADGTVTASLRHLLVEPDNNRPEVGPHLITVIGADGLGGAASLTVTPNTFEAIPVSLSRDTLTQDEFLDVPVEVTATGLEPNERVWVNLGLPDGSGQGIEPDSYLHADADGVFRYSLQSISANSAVGRWTVSVVSNTPAGDGYFPLSGSASFEVTPGRERVSRGAVALAVDQVTTTAFSAGGVDFTVSGFGPFDPYELLLTTPRGLSVPLGMARANGEGRRADRISGFDGAPQGTYTLMARSMITGNYAQGTFVVTDQLGEVAPAPQVAVTPARLTAAQATSTGLTISATGMLPDSIVIISFRDAAWHRQPFTTGPEIYATTAADGSLAVPAVLMGTPAPGDYTVMVTQFDPNGADLNISQRVTVTILPAAGTTTSSAAPAETTPAAGAPNSGATLRTFRPDAPAPAPNGTSTGTGDKGAAPTPSPAPTGAPTANPLTEDTVGPLGTFQFPAPAPVTD